MAFNKDQNEPKVPLSNSEKRETSNLLPRYYRTKDNKKFLIRKNTVTNIYFTKNINKFKKPLRL